MSRTSHMITCEGCGQRKALRLYGNHWSRSHRNLGDRPSGRVTVPVDSTLGRILVENEGRQNEDRRNEGDIVESPTDGENWGFGADAGVPVADYIEVEEPESSMVEEEEAHPVLDRLFKDAGSSNSS